MKIALVVAAAVALAPLVLLYAALTPLLAHDPALVAPRSAS